MQGTVATFDAEARSGTLLLDDGTALEFDAEAFAVSGLRHLRLGQRVVVELGTENEPAGRVRSVRIPGIS
jgi:cold shock CspA family protein